MGKYVLGIDQSTQGTKGLLFDEAGSLVGRCDRSHNQYVNEKGWVEHNPIEIINNTVAVVKDVVEKTGINKDDIVTVGISNQRETAMLWDKKTKKPVYNAIVWQCARAEEICQRLQATGIKEQVKAKTGLQLSPYFSAAKLCWIVENVEGVKEKMENGELMAGTMDSWLVYNLTGNHKTDYSNAARTQLFNIIDLKWDTELCKVFSINPNCLPQVADSNSDFGETDFNGYLSKPIKIQAVLGDSNGALFGQGCLQKGMTKATYGTGSSVMMNLGETPVFSTKGVVTSLAWSLNGKINYVLEGNINYTGSVIGWVKKDLNMIESVADARTLPQLANPKDTTYFVPAFTGMGAPYWDSQATGLFTGITRITGKAEMVKATVDCIAYQIADIAGLMATESKLNLKELRVDGGPTENTYLMQFQSDILNTPVVVPQLEELSGMGVAFAAGIKNGLYNIKTVYSGISHTAYQSKMDSTTRQTLYSGWKQAVQRALYHMD